MSRAILGLVLLCSLGCSASPDDTIDVTFDPCSTRLALTAPSEEQRLAAERAIQMWNGSGGFALEIGEAAPPESLLRVEFDDAADAFRGVYDDERGVVFINRRLSGPSLAVVLAHELGHSFGLPHVGKDTKRSVMNPGNLEVEPTAWDVENVTSLWGACSSR